MATDYSRKHSPVGEDNAKEYISREGNEFAQPELPLMEETCAKH
jgi:hypothetical protein